MRRSPSRATKSSSRARRSANGRSRRSSVAVGEKIVGAQMRGKFGDQLRRDGFAVEPLLQHVEGLHAALAHDQKFAVDGAGEAQGVEQIGKALGDVFAGARIKPRDPSCRPCRAATACTRMPSHFHSAMKSAGIEPGKSLVVERMRQHRRPERRRIAARRFFRAAFEPGEQIAIGRRKPGPDQLDLLRVLAAERRGRGLGEPRRDADAQSAGDELDQRPAPGLVERIEPARQLLPAVRALPSVASGLDDGGERNPSSSRVDARRAAPATSARRSRTGRRHSRRTVRTAPGRYVRRSGCG